MRTLISNFKHSLFFLFPYGLFLISAGIILAVYPKADIHHFFNSHYSGFADTVIPYVTLGADGWTITILVILLIAWDRRFGLLTGISCLVATAFTQLLKHSLYADAPRPKLYFANLPSPLRLIPGVDNDLFDSFPSGHTTVAFAFFFCLVFAVKNNYLKFLFFALALFVGYSRIYLSQHFLSDVYVGSIVGTVSAFAVMTFAMHKNWMNKSKIGKLHEA